MAAHYVAAACTAVSKIGLELDMAKYGNREAQVPVNDVNNAKWCLYLFNARAAAYCPRVTDPQMKERMTLTFAKWVFDNERQTSTMSGLDALTTFFATQPDCQ
jgi:hypothetical protein